MNLSKEKFLIKRHSERSHAVAKSKNLGRCVIASLVRGVAISCLLFLAACGDDPKVGGTEEDAGIIAIENKTVSGVSQKGPFVNGSSVKLYEMDGETLAPTGKSFPGKIASDDGRFTVPSISLASQYALLEANGYFRNEITGGKSNGTITLNALTDLSDREKVNINLLTHLEYERALYLVGTGVKVSEAKKQAESEILDAFEIKGEFENSEDLDIFSSGDGNAALLAFSVLMLGNLTEADLTERLTNFATGVEQDGKWDDEKTKAIIADWASGMSLADGLAGIRNNIAGWNFSNDVPAFEKYVNNFWWQNYGLGICDAKREGEVLKNQNTASTRAKDYFICKSGAWGVASVFDIDAAMLLEDTYGKECSKFGKIIYGNINKENEYFCNGDKWKKFYGNDSISYGKLVDERDGQIYRTVKIGNQTWMAENLNFEKEGSCCAGGIGLDLQSGRCDLLGRLYGWEQAQNACPKNYHLPSTEEYDSLFVYAGGKKTIPSWWDGECALLGKCGKYEGMGEFFKAKTSLWYTLYDLGKMDKYGFSAMPTGVYVDSQGYSLQREVANFWTSSGENFEHPVDVQIATDGDSTSGSYMSYDNEEISIGQSGRYDRLSVRCVKDEE